MSSQEPALALPEPAEPGRLQEEVGWRTSQQLFLGCILHLRVSHPLNGSQARV